MNLTTNGDVSIDHHTFAREMEDSIIRHVDMDRACDEVFHMRVYVEREDGTKRTYYIAGRGDAKGGFLEINAKDDDWQHRQPPFKLSDLPDNSDTILRGGVILDD